MLALLAALLASPGLVQVWSVDDGRLLQTVQTDGVRFAWIADDGELTLAGGTAPAGVRHVEARDYRGQTADGRFVIDIDSIRRSTTGRPVVDLSWGFPSSEGWLTLDEGLGLVEWNMAPGTVRRRRLGHGGQRRMLFVPTADGPRLIVGVVDRAALHVFAGPDWARTHRIELPESAGDIGDLAVAGTTVFVLGGRTLFRLDPRVGRLDALPVGEVDAFAVTPDGRHLAIARGGALWLGTTAQPERLRRLKVAPNEHDAVAISPDGRRVALSDRPGDVRVFATATGRSIWRRRVPLEPSASRISIVYGPDVIDFAPDGTLQVAPDDGDVITVGFTGRRPVEGRQTFDARVWPAWTPDGETFAVKGPNGVCLVTDGVCRTQVAFMNAPDNVALSPDGNVLAVAYYDGAVAVMRVDGRAMGGRDDPPDGVVAAAWKQAGPRVAVGRRLHAWSPERAEIQRVGPWLLGVSDADRTAIALKGAAEVAMPDVSAPFALAGSTVVWSATRASQATSVLRAFDLAAQRPIAWKTDHRHPIEQIVGSARGRWVATADRGGRIAVWRGDGLRPAQRFETGRAVRALTFDPREERLVAVLGEPQTAPPPSPEPAPTLEPVAGTVDGIRHFVSEVHISALAAVGDGLLVGVGQRLMHLDQGGEVTPVHDFDAVIELLATDGCRAFAVLEGARSLHVVPLGASAAAPAPPGEAPGPELGAGLLSAPSPRPSLLADPGVRGFDAIMADAMAGDGGEVTPDPPEPDPPARSAGRVAAAPCPATEPAMWAAPGNGRLRDAESNHPTGNLLYDADADRVWLGTGYGVVVWDAQGEAIRIPAIPLDGEPEPGRVVGLDLTALGARALVKGASGAWTVAVRPDGRIGPPVAIRGLDGEPRDIVAVGGPSTVVVTDTSVALVRGGRVKSSFEPEALRQNEPGIMVAAVARPGAAHIADGWTLGALRRAPLRRGRLEVQGQRGFPEPYTHVQLASLVRWKGGLAASWYDDGSYGITLFEDDSR